MRIFRLNEMIARRNGGLQIVCVDGIGYLNYYPPKWWLTKYNTKGNRKNIYSAARAVYKQRWYILFAEEIARREGGLSTIHAGYLVKIQVANINGDTVTRRIGGLSIEVV